MKKLPALLSAALLATGDAQAQASTAPDVVKVVGAAESARRLDTSSRIVVSRDEILKFGDPNLLEVMKRLPGVTVSSNEVRMRGLGSGYTQILVNGERQAPGFALESLSPDAIERIEILRAATAEFSTQAVAGTINIVTRRSVGKASHEVKVAVGDVRTRPTGLTVNSSDKRGSLSYTAGASLNHGDSTITPVDSDEERNASGQVIGRRQTVNQNNNQFTGLNLNARLNWVLADASTVSWQTLASGARYSGASAQHTETQVGSRYPMRELDVRFRGENTTVRSDVSWASKFGETGKLDTKVGVYKLDNEPSMYRQGRDDAGATVLERRYSTYVDDRGATYTGKVSFGWGESHALAVGWDIGRSRYDEREVQNESAALSAGTPRDFDNAFTASIERIALYVQDEWDVSAALSLYLGMRAEGVNTRSSGANFSTLAHSRVLSPLMQALYRIPGAKNDQLRFALTRSYKAPELRRLIPRQFYTSFNSAVTPDQTGNPTLKPELAVGIDLAYEHYWGSGAMVSASGSARKIDGLVRSAVRFDGDRWLAYPENSGEALVRTIELEAKFPLRALFAKAPAIDLRTSVSRNWSRVDGVPGPDNRLDRQPRWSANLGADYKHGKFGAGASLALVSGGATRLSLAESSFASPKRDLSAYALYKFDPKRQLRLSLLNLLTTDATQASRYADAQGSLQSSTWSEAYLGWRLQYEHKH